MENNIKKSAFDQIKECIWNNKSFILEAWAGSWKTYTLIQTIQYLLNEKWDYFAKNWQKIVCITYTNVAKNELIERLNYNELVEINTIHEFLWSIISNYQVNLKKELFIHNNTFDNDKKVDNLETILNEKDIKYTWKYWRKFEEWYLHHDDVIYLSIKLLENYEKLQQILIWKFPYFFIDEYQDTSRPLVEILLKILKTYKDKFLLWFFWDFMQKIYDKDTIWKITDDNLNVIQKVENYRSWKKIVEVINKVRNLEDSLVQISQNKFDWEIFFFHSNTWNNEDNIEKVKKELWWDFNWQPEENKILVLSNSKIAKDLWYDTLLKIFDARYGWWNWMERLKEKDEPYTWFLLDNVEKIVKSYEDKNYSEFFLLFWDEDFKIKTLEDREKLKCLIDNLSIIRKEKNIWEVLNFIFKNKILIKTDKIISFEKYLIEDVEEDKKEKQNIAIQFKEDLMNLDYKEIMNFNQYMEDKTPYSTQHGTKWAEYKNVLLIIDDNPKWNFYNRFCKTINWQQLYKNSSNEEEAKRKHINLFYVSLSRAKEKLAVLCLNNDNIEWFKDIFWENIKNLNDL